MTNEEKYETYLIYFFYLGGLIPLFILLNKDLFSCLCNL